MAEPGAQSAGGRFRDAAADWGCGFGFSVAGLAIGLWADGMWAGQAGAFLGFMIGGWLLERRHGRRVASHMIAGPAAFLILVCLVAAAVPKIQKARERLRVEREALQHVPAESSGVEPK